MSVVYSLTDHMDTESFNLDHDFLGNMDLDTFNQSCLDEIMSEVPLSMTIEDEITLMQDGDFLDLHDHGSLPCKQGIEAQDLGSLLDQFEEASQTIGDCDYLQPTINFFSNEETEVKDNEDSEITAKKELTDAMLQRLKTSTKPKSTVMLPLAVPAKRGRGRAMTRGHPVGLPTNCTSRSLQRVMQQNVEFKDSISLIEPEPEIKSKKSEAKKKIGSDISNVEKDVDDAYFNLIIDHDYPKNVANPKVDPTTERSQNVYDDIEEGELVEEVVEVVDKDFDKFKKIPDKAKCDRNYRKRSASPEQVVDDSLYFDKLPSYYTALSIPRKQFKKTASASCVGRGGISVHDYIERDQSPVRDNSMYNKLPDYHSSFTNSTKYDYLNVEPTKGCDESKLSSGYSSLNHSPERPSRSRSRSSSCSKSGYRPSRRSSKRRSSYSPCSGYSSSRSRSCSRSSCDGSHASSRSSSSSSSSSCSTCDSRSSSRSRSRSPVSRSWQREHNLRQERSRWSRQQRSSRSSDTYRSRSRSGSQRYRSRSRSRGYSVQRKTVKERSLSKERWREQRKKEREEEKKRQMKDRRIVYVGGLPSSYTRRQLRENFSHFGEIENVQIHFREHGDNYGFVTFMYTCDAYAAIEKGKTIPALRGFDLCFGGRRQFCDVEYADLDGNKEIEEEYESKPRSAGMMDFDELLKQARQKIKKS